MRRFIAGFMLGALIGAAATAVMAADRGVGFVRPLTVGNLWLIPEWARTLWVDGWMAGFVYARMSSDAADTERCFRQKRFTASDLRARMDQRSVRYSTGSAPPDWHVVTLAMSEAVDDVCGRGP